MKNELKSRSWLYEREVPEDWGGIEEYEPYEKYSFRYPILFEKLYLMLDFQTALPLYGTASINHGVFS